MQDETKLESKKVEVLPVAMIEHAQKIALLMTQIERATSIGVVRNFLKSRGLKHSASSWEELRTRRIIPALEQESISVDDLYALLRRTEGFGRQHVFLYSCAPDRAASMLSEERLRPILRDRGILVAHGSPLLVELPEVPTIVDVVWCGTSENKYVLFKEVEKRTTRKPRPEAVDQSAKTITRIWDIEEHRAVNFARLWANGLFEIRIASKDNATRYHDDLAGIFDRLKPFFMRSEFREISLKSVKQNLWAKKSELKDCVRFSTYTLTNDEGLTLRANASLSTDDLAESEVLDKSLSEFMSDETTHCSDSNIYLNTSDGGEPNWVHVLLNGEDNEFAITAAIVSEEYEYVLQQIQAHN
ncbi:hypothetical protein [Sphaerotilus montanus]|uniref:hypothetical protein n=1 Tax=Sphaerotilus montanus TaxID=522889 RepID=UPI003FA203A5